MAKYQRKGYKFLDGGLNIATPPDLCPEDQYPYLLNLYSPTTGVLQPRPGLTPISQGHDGSIVTVKRVNNEIPGGTPFQRFVMDSGGMLWGGENGDVELDSGYSGRPVSMVTGRPAQSPEAWVFIADTGKMTKARTAQNEVRFWGIEPPNKEPSVAIGQPIYDIVGYITGTPGWSAGGIAAAPTFQQRVPASTTVSAILFDSGTTGWACIVPT